MLPRTLLALLAAGLLAGCAHSSYHNAADHPLIAATQKSADTLIQNVGAAIAPGTPLIIATLVDVNDLDRSSAFGRAVSEQLTTHFVRSPFRVIELKYRNSVYVRRSQGELVLTREIKELAQTHNAGAVVAGTYTVGGDSVFVNLKLIRPDDNTILAGSNLALPLDSDTRALLKSKP